MNSYILGFTLLMVIAANDAPGTVTILIFSDFNLYKIPHVFYNVKSHASNMQEALHN